MNRDFWIVDDSGKILQHTNSYVLHSRDLCRLAPCRIPDLERVPTHEA